MKSYVRLGAICVALVAIVRADTFWWKGGGDYRSFDDANWWGVGQSQESGNPEGRVPGVEDDIDYSPGTLAFDMGGAEHYVRAFVSSASGTLWDRRYVYIKNGTLGFNESFSNVCVTVNVDTGGRFVLGMDCATRFGLSAASAAYDIRGEAVLQGRMSIECLQAIVQQGGTLTFAPSDAVSIPQSHSSAIPISYLENSGSMKIPNGIVLSAGGKAGDASGFEIHQKAGTLELGGVFARPANCHDDFRLKILGGALVAVDDVAFSNLTEMTVADGMCLPIEVASGKHLNLRGMTFGEGTSVSKDGGGSLSFGSRAPDALTISEGTLVLDNTEFQTIEFGDHASVAVASGLRTELAVAFGSDDVLNALKARMDNPGSYEIRDGGLFKVASRTSQSFCWKAAETYSRYGDPSLWGIGVSTDAQNSDGLVPGPHDLIAFRKADTRFDLDGFWWRVGGLDWSTASGWTAYAFAIRNGTLEVTTCFTNFFKVAVEAGGRFSTGSRSASQLGKGGICNTYDIGPSGCVDLAGSFTFQYVRANIRNGGKMSFCPSQSIVVPASLFDEVGVSYFENDGGTLSMPLGFAFGPGGRNDKSPATFEVRQRKGELLLGGVFYKDANSHYDVNISLSGGVVDVPNDVSFVGLTKLMVEECATVTNRVKAGRVCDFSPLTFGKGATFVKKGDGTLLLGAGRPDSLVVEEGTIDFSAAGDIGACLDLKGGTELRISVSGLSAESISGLESEDVSVFLSEALKRKRTELFRSANPELLETLIRKLDAPPEGFEYRIVGGVLSYERKHTGFLLTVR